MRSKLTILIVFLVIIGVALVLFFLNKYYKAESISDDPVEVNLTLIDEATKQIITVNEEVILYVSDSSFNTENTPLEFCFTKEAITKFFLPSPSYNSLLIQVPGYKNMMATAHWQGTTINPRTMTGVISLTPGEGTEVAHLFVFEQGQNDFAIPFSTESTHASEVMKYYRESKEGFEQVALDLSNNNFSRYKPDGTGVESWSTENDFPIEVGKAYSFKFNSEPEAFEQRIVLFRSNQSGEEFFNAIELKKGKDLSITFSNSNNITTDELIFKRGLDEKTYEEALHLRWLEGNIKFYDYTNKFGSKPLEIGTSENPEFTNQIMPGWVVQITARADGVSVKRALPKIESDNTIGMVWGNLKNEVGAPMPNINIVIGIDTIKSDQDGNYSSYSLPVGMYQVQFFDDSGKRYYDKRNWEGSIFVVSGQTSSTDYILTEATYE